MNWYKESQTQEEGSGLTQDQTQFGIAPIAPPQEKITATPQEEIATPANPLDGMTPAQAKKTLNKIIPHELIKGFFSDDSWQGIQQIWNAFNDAGVNWSIAKSEYTPTDNGHPMGGKTWTVEVDYTDRKARPSKVYGLVRAAGAGSVENPLERYDIVAYFV